MRKPSLPVMSLCLSVGSKPKANRSSAQPVNPGTLIKSWACSFTVLCLMLIQAPEPLAFSIKGPCSSFCGCHSRFFLMPMYRSGHKSMTMTSKFTNLRVRVLDSCPELYVGIKKNLLWQPQNDEHQRRYWLAPKADVAAADPVAKEMPKAVPAGLAAAALSSRYVQTSAGRELSRTYATAHSIAGFRRVPIYTLAPNPRPLKS